MLGRTLMTFALGSLLASCSSSYGSQTSPDPYPATDTSKKKPGADAAPAADGAEQTFVVTTPVVDGTTPNRTTGLAACVDGKQHYALVSGGNFSWSVAKADGTPVTGVHAVTGELVMAITEPLATAVMHVDFNKTGAFTGQATRDERMGTTLFGAGDKLGFTLESVTAKNGKSALPEEGLAEELNLNGTLDVAGFAVKIAVPVVVSNRGGSLHVSDATSGVKYQLRTQWHIDAPLDAFLALAQAKIDEAIAFRFDLDLKKTCSN